MLQGKASADMAAKDRDYEAQQRREQREFDRQQRLEELRQQALKDKFIMQQQALQNLASGQLNVMETNRAASKDLIDQYNNVGNSLAGIYLRG
ncbi:MAG: hypothetical protein E6Q97_36210 [Desulfurellales bacterium]|nr:MAG: hypothetical protein E6Q97_36210 [Desulfurellales bacterium]